MRKFIVATALGLVVAAAPALAADRSGTTSGTGTTAVKCDPDRVGYTMAGAQDPRCTAERSRSYDTRTGPGSDATAPPQKGLDGPRGNGAGSGAGSGSGGAFGAGGSGGSGGSGRSGG